MRVDAEKVPPSMMERATVSLPKPQSKLREFVELAHVLGVSVILRMALQRMTAI
jgi:hypothetical protein